MDKVRGKFRMNSVKRLAGYNASILGFSAVCNDGTPENDRFHKYTPSGTLEMNVDNPAAVEFFELGKTYYLDFTKAE